MTPEERLKGETADISFLLEFQWYQRVWYIEPTDKYEKHHLGQSLGPCNMAGGGGGYGKLGTHHESNGEGKDFHCSHTTGSQ